MTLTDSHCHVHDGYYQLEADEVLRAARQAGVSAMITVGTDVANSRRALEFAAQHDGVYATIGVHPGETPKGTIAELEELINFSAFKPVGFGDIGLDYHYGQSNRAEQIKLFEAQLDLAHQHHLPVSFHVRQAFVDFWPIFDNFPGLNGTLHSYTDNPDNLEKALKRGLYISVNGIVTFNREPKLAQVFQTIPLDRLLLETDAPYLAPRPHRGKVNQPAYIKEIAEFYAEARGLSLNEVATATTNNAKKLFNLSLKSRLL